MVSNDFYDSAKYPKSDKIVQFALTESRTKDKIRHIHFEIGWGQMEGNELLWNIGHICYSADYVCAMCRMCVCVCVTY